MDRKAFTFLRSYYNQLKELDNSKRLNILDALMEFALNGVKPKPFDTLLERVVWEGIIATLSPSRQGWADKTGGVMYPPCVGGGQGVDTPPAPQKSKEEKSKEERKEAFKERLTPYLEKYSKPMLREFFLYWTESGSNDRKLRFEKEKTFDEARRLATWKKNEKRFGGDDSDVDPWANKPRI